LNVTAVPQGPLGALILYPNGKPPLNVSTLNSSTGTVVANAAIVPAGSNGSIDISATNPTDVVIDVDGYFAAPQAAGLQFYPVTPCRLMDTRAAAGFTGAFGPPSLAAGATRAIPVPSGACGIPVTAAAYSVNATVVPHEPLGLLSLWPAGQSQPGVSTLNSYTGTVVANAAIVPAGTGGAINAYVSNATDLVIDINGYFAPSSGSGLNFYPLTPCRVADTRAAAGFGGPFGLPSLAAGTSRTFPVNESICGAPAGAGAYSLNVTGVPQGPLGALEIWPAGSAQPVVSTLNSYTGAVVANAAIVPAGTGFGGINVSVTNPADLVLDINGYFGK
jgi:hypothetical protein